MTYTRIGVNGAPSKAHPSVIKSATPTIALTEFDAGQLVQIAGQYQEDWVTVSAISAAVSPVGKCVIVSHDTTNKPYSYLVHLVGCVWVPIASGTTLTDALLYDWTNKRFTTTASASTFDVSSRFRLEQIVGLQGSVEFK